MLVPILMLLYYFVMLLLVLCLGVDSTAVSGSYFVLLLVMSGYMYRW